MSAHGIVPGQTWDRRGGGRRLTIDRLVWSTYQRDYHVHATDDAGQPTRLLTASLRAMYALASSAPAKAVTP